MSESLGETWACNPEDPQEGWGLPQGGGEPQWAAMVLTVGTSKETERLFPYMGSSVCEGEGMRTETVIRGNPWEPPQSQLSRGGGPTPGCLQASSPLVCTPASTIHFPPQVSASQQSFLFHFSVP